MPHYLRVGADGAAGTLELDSSLDGALRRELQASTAANVTFGSLGKLVLGYGFNISQPDCHRQRQPVQKPCTMAGLSRARRWKYERRDRHAGRGFSASPHCR